MQFLHGGHGVETIRIVGPFRFMDSMRRGEGRVAGHFKKRYTKVVAKLLLNL